MGATEEITAYTGMNEEDMIEDIKEALHFSCFDTMEEAVKYRMRSSKGRAIQGYNVSIKIDKI